MSQSSPSQRRIALVACVGKKKSWALPGRDLYVSHWFQKASVYAREVADEWYILSAKHGLLTPETVIEPYDETLTWMPAANRRAWASRVLDQMKGVLEAGDEIVILAGKSYREHLVGPIREMGCSVHVPMEGLRIGEQLRWLNQRLNDGQSE